MGRVRPEPRKRSRTFARRNQIEGIDMLTSEHARHSRVTSNTSQAPENIRRRRICKIMNDMLRLIFVVLYSKAAEQKSSWFQGFRELPDHIDGII